MFSKRRADYNLRAKFVIPSREKAKDLASPLCITLLKASVIGESVRDPSLRSG